jgi:hypothetical protein
LPFYGSIVARIVEVNMLRTKSATAAATFMLSLAAVGPLTAMDVKQYREGRKDSAKEIGLDAYIFGVAQGFGWANDFLTGANRPTLFCAPPNLALTAHTSKMMIDEMIKAVGPKLKTQLESTPVELLLLDALTKTFPCPGDQQEKKQ